MDYDEDISLTKLYITDDSEIDSDDDSNSDQDYDYVTSMRTNECSSGGHCDCFYCSIHCDDSDDSEFVLDEKLLERINKAEQSHISTIENQFLYV